MTRKRGAGTPAPPAAAISTDAPLTDAAQDRLQIHAFAERVANAVMSVPSDGGAVVALYGRWGTGKSTLLNFIAADLEQLSNPPRIVWFSPWWFSDGDDLVRRFFDELIAVVSRGRARARAAVTQLSRYAQLVGELPIPFAGAAKAAGAALAPQQRSVHTTRRKLESALKRAGIRTVVVIDDIDRLTSDEIRQVFRLIKSVANLPGVTYLVAFERTVVTEALNPVAGGRGSEYLEKIVQAGFDIPLPQPGPLVSMLGDRIQPVFADTPAELWSTREFQNLVAHSLVRLLRTPRAVVRLANALAVTYPPVRDDVHGVDFLGIETLRLFAPAVYDLIREHPSQFLVLGAARQTKEDLTAFHHAWLANVPEAEKDAVTYLVTSRFPMTKIVFGNVHHGPEWEGQWAQQHRIASRAHFATYLRGEVPPGHFSRAQLREYQPDAFNRSAFATRISMLATQPAEEGGTKALAWINVLHGQLLGWLQHASTSTAQSQAEGDDGDPVAVSAPPSGGQLQQLALGLSDVADMLIESEPRSSFFSAPVEWQLMWPLRIVLQLLPLNARLELMDEMLRTSRSHRYSLRAYDWFVRPARDDGDDTSRQTGERNTDEELFTDEGRSELDIALRARLARDAAHVGEPTGLPVDVWLRAMRGLGEEDTARAQLLERLTNESFAIAFLESFTREGRSLADGDAMAVPFFRFNVAETLQWVDWPTLQALVDRLTPERWAGEQAAAVRTGVAQHAGHQAEPGAPDEVDGASAAGKSL